VPLKPVVVDIQIQIQILFEQSISPPVLFCSVLRRVPIPHREAASREVFATVVKALTWFVIAMRGLTPMSACIFRFVKPIYER
jgi:hypothetical protein